MTFKPAARYPADPRVVFVLALAVLTGITSLVIKAAPESLESVMPNWAVVAWGILLTIGSIVTLVGISSNTLGGILAEQVGSVMVGATTTFYSIVATLVVGPSALQTIGIIFAFGVACIIRWLQLQALIKTAYREQVRVEVEQKFLDDLDSL